jgi:hypothetical protein
MSNLQSEPVPTYFRMWRQQHDLEFESFFITKDDKPIKVHFRRNSYDFQSWGTVDIWNEASGWNRIVTVGLDVLVNIEPLSYLSVPEDKTKVNYTEKYNTALQAFWLDTKEILQIALQIVRPHDTIKV